MITKPFDKVVKEDIDELVSNKTQEGRQLDYKQALPGNTDGDKKEFLADVSSFANSLGGWLIYGVTEKRDGNNKATGMPESAGGLGEINADEVIKRLEAILRDGVDPRITGVQIKPLSGFSNGSVILIHVPKSWNSPHMVTFQQSSKFYARNNAGKYQLDLGEIRSAFALSETLPEKIRRFREDRIAKILADETPAPLNGKHRVVLHLIPLSSMASTSVVDMSQVQENRSNLCPICSSGYHIRYNFDGFLAYGNTTYLQVFRNGAVEAAESLLLNNGNSIPSSSFKSELYKAVECYLKLQQSIGIDPPIIILLTLLGVKGYSLAYQNSMLINMSREQPKIDRDILALPDIMVEDFTTTPDALLRPVFDMIWQAFGFAACPNYDSDGRWKNAL